MFLWGSLSLLLSSRSFFVLLVASLSGSQESGIVGPSRAVLPRAARVLRLGSSFLRPFSLHSCFFASNRGLVNRRSELVTLWGFLALVVEVLGAVRGRRHLSFLFGDRFVVC